MPNTLIPNCPFCGLRYANEPLLELHIREDHPRRYHPGEPDHDDSGDAQGSRPDAGGPSSRRGLTTRLPRTTNEVIATTATRRPRRPRPGWVMTASRGAFRTLRHVNDELVRVSEAILRPAGAPRPHPQAEEPAARDAHAASTTERADLAA